MAYALWAPHSDFSVDIDRYTFAARKSTGGAFAYQSVFCVHVVLAVVDRAFFLLSPFSLHRSNEEGRSAFGCHIFYISHSPYTRWLNDEIRISGDLAFPLYLLLFVRI